MLSPTRYITITKGQTVERLTPEQAKVRAVQLAARVNEAKGTLLHERVALGVFLLQVKDELGRGAYGMWLNSGGVHLKTASRCMRLAVRCGDEKGGIDRRKLFDMMHRADPAAFPSFEKFDEHRLSLARVERAVAIPLPQFAHDLKPSHRTNIQPGQTVSDSGKQQAWRGAGDLPRARVEDIAGQGVLHGLFAPIARRIEAVCGVYDRLDASKRRRVDEINARWDRDMAEVVGTSDFPLPTSHIQQRPPRDPGVVTQGAAPGFVASSSLDARHNNDSTSGHDGV